MAKATKGASQNGDTPFTFKSKTGATIKIPAGTEFDPDMMVLAELSRAQREGDEQAAGIAFMEMIATGFPPEIAKTIKIKASEMVAFTTAFQKHSGVNIPKS